MNAQTVEINSNRSGKFVCCVVQPKIAPLTTMPSMKLAAMCVLFIDFEFADFANIHIIPSEKMLCRPKNYSARVWSCDVIDVKDVENNAHIDGSIRFDGVLFLAVSGSCICSIHDTTNVHFFSCCLFEM